MDSFVGTVHFIEYDEIFLNRAVSSAVTVVIKT